ncbi:MAG: GNAT family N-acetyltransferase [Candidatus Saccharimonadales bacterium]
MTHVLGLLSSTGEGFDMDLFVNASHPTPPTETVELKDGYLLDIIDVPVRNKTRLDRAVGYASLHPTNVVGEYAGSYGVNADVQGKGIASNSMRTVFRRVMEQDERFSAAKFLITTTNARSIHVAQSLGSNPGRQL